MLRTLGDWGCLWTTAQPPSLKKTPLPRNVTLVIIIFLRTAWIVFWLFMFILQGNIVMLPFLPGNPHGSFMNVLYRDDRAKPGGQWELLFWTVCVCIILPQVRTFGDHFCSFLRHDLCCIPSPDFHNECLTTLIWWLMEISHLKLSKHWVRSNLGLFSTIYNPVP